MKDIKSLYLAAKHSGSKSDISAYAEAVHELFENAPNDYISNLEYIIQSDLGVSTLKEFVEKHGLPIACYDSVMEHLEHCINKSQKLGIDSTAYQEAAAYMEDFRQKYIGCFMMEGYFGDQRPDDYIKTYYGVNKSGIPNRKLAAGLIEKFKEYAIPDIIVTADKIGSNAMNTALSYIESQTAYGDPGTCEWVLECIKTIVPETSTVRSMVESKASSTIIRNMRDRKHQCYREAVITENDDIVMEYSEDEIEAIQNLISFNEYKLTWADDLKESASDIQNTIYSLYEEFDGLTDEDGVLLTESIQNVNSAATKIAKNIGKVRKEIMSLIKPVIRDRVKKHNKEAGLFRSIQYPIIDIYVKGKHGDDKIFIKRAVKKYIDDIAYTEDEFVDTISLSIQFKIDSGSANHDRKSFNLFIDAMLDALEPMQKRGEISFKRRSDSYYVSLSYIRIPIYISKDRMLEDVDIDFEEAGINLAEFVADNVIPMLPGASGVVKPMEERPWLVNTRNKKTGDIPGYIRRNHNLGYGEDDGPSNYGATTNDSGVAEPTLDDFKRPSAIDSNPDPYTNLDKGEPDENTSNQTDLTPAEQKAVNNYYYYTYNNSLNKTQGSYNRTHDDHSVRSNTHTTDDHSTGKNINSRNSTSHSNPSEDDSEDLKERTEPWSLNIFENQLFSEGVDVKTLEENFTKSFTESMEDESYICEAEVKFFYTYRTVKASDGDFYLIKFDIDGPGVVNYKLHYPDATDKTVKFVGRISGEYLKRYGNDNYVSKGNKILSITNLRTKKKVQSVTASGAVPANGNKMDSIGSTSIVYTVGEPSPLSYKTTVPIYPMLGTVNTPFGSMKGLSITPRAGDVLNPFKSRRIDFSKPLLYKERYASLAVILKPAMMNIGDNIKEYRKSPVNSIQMDLKEKIKSNKLYQDYLIAPLDIGEYNNILLMASIFIHNCANNITQKPWVDIPNIYQGLLIGFFGPKIGGNKYINIDIMEPVTSKRYMVNTNIFQNISDWFTLIANGLAQLVGVDEDKRNSYYKQHEEIKELIRDTFYRKDPASIYEDGGFITEGVLDKVKDIFSKRKKAPSIPPTKHVYTFQYLPLNDDDKQVIIGNINKLKEQMDTRLNPIFSKYPIYGLHVRINEDDISSCFEVIKDDPNSPGNTITIPGIRVSDGSIELEITPEVVGSDQYEFMEEMERNHPDEIKRLSASYDITKRYDWMCIHWEEKICGYDKDLNEITTEIERIISSEFTMIKDFGFCGDNDSGPCYDGKIDEKYLFPTFDSSKLETATWTWIPKSFSTMSVPEKHFFGIRHDHQFSEAVDVYKEGFMDAIKKISSRLKTLFTMKKTLKNIQSLDTPAASKMRVPLTIPGTSIPLKIQTTSNKPKLESTEDVFTEDGEGFHLSKYDTANIVKRLRKKFRAEILFVNNNNYMIAQQIGPASLVETDRATIEKLIRGKSVEKLPGRLLGDEGEFEKVIFVNPSIIREFMISRPEDLELIISHEYGHVLTLDQISNDDWVEYQTKRNMIAGLGQALYMDDAQAMAECNMGYYKLKPEAIANKAMNIDPAKLTYAIMKRRATGKLDKLDIDGIVNLNIPPSVMKLGRETARGKSTSSLQDLTESVRFSATVYKKVVRDKNMLKLLLESLDRTLKMYEEYMSSKSESVYAEDVGDADDDRPKSDHPVKDILTDVDRALVKKQQGAKRVAQNVQNVGRAFMKPAVRTSKWVDNMVHNWKDADENTVKEKLADPHARSNLFSAIRTAIVGGSLLKAGLLLNPVFLGLTVLRRFGKDKREFRIRNEMIGELKTEMEIIDEKIKDADRVGDIKAKYKLMRFKNELNKKLLRVGGPKGWKKMI